MRILIVGASGLVGSHVTVEAIRRGHGTTGTFRHFPVDGLRRLDLADESTTRALLHEVRPDWVVHAAGWTWVDGCEKDPARAHLENAEQPAALARLCREARARFAYFSTTYVFDGEAGPYRESDQPSPINIYAAAKWAGEQAVQRELQGEALIPRVICVWGREEQRKNFGYQVIKAVREGRPLRLPSDQAGNPTWAGDIAAWLLDLIEAGERGVWNLVGDRPHCLRAEWADAIVAGLRTHAPAMAEALAAWSYETVSTSSLQQPARRPLAAGGWDEKIQARFPRRPRRPDEVEILLP